VLPALVLVLAPGASETLGKRSPALVVNSLADDPAPPAGTVTLRSAIEAAGPGQTISFDPALDGGTIRLTIPATDHAVLRGEVFVAGKFTGYEERDYGRSALYAAKDLAIDASSLPGGVSLVWDGGGAAPARVLAVLGDLRLENISISGGFSRGEAIEGTTQPFTLARGGGIAVWGTAILRRVTVSGNRVEGDLNASRDRGAFGGGIYGNRLLLSDCVVSGNSAAGYGAAGGGVYSVGGAGFRKGGSSLERCAVTGNRVTAQHAYGGGVYSDGGGPGETKTIGIVNCTLAGNAVEDHPDLDEPPGSQYYYRGGGFYMSNGSLRLGSSTIAGNAVTGHPAVFNNRPNMGGGGVAATIGNAHVVHFMELWQPIVAGNTVAGAAQDVYTGSLLEFRSLGWNRIGNLDMSQILAPIPAWMWLCRRHWPKTGDLDGVAAAEVLSLGETVRHDTIVSVGADEGERAVRWIPPGEGAEDRIPRRRTRVRLVSAGYTAPLTGPDPFLNRVLAKVRADHGDVLGADFGSGFGDLTDTPFVAVDSVWPAEPANAPWIAFWRALDAEIAGRLGPAGLNDGFWESFEPRYADNGAVLTVQRRTLSARPPRTDQRGHPRPASLADIGAIEE
jgi:hypothetical protein